MRDFSNMVRVDNLDRFDYYIRHASIEDGNCLEKEMKKFIDKKIVVKRYDDAGAWFVCDRGFLWHKSWIKEIL